MDRRGFLLAAGVGAVAPKSVLAKGAAGGAELTLADIASAFADGRLTSQRLTQIYLERIDALDRRGPSLRPRGPSYRRTGIST